MAPEVGSVATEKEYLKCMKRVTIYDISNFLKQTQQAHTDRFPSLDFTHL